MIARIEPSPAPPRLLEELEDDESDRGLTHTLEAQFIEASERAEAQYRQAVAADMAWLDRTSRELGTLIRKRAQAITGQPWETVMVSEQRGGVQLHQRKFTGKLNRYRLGKRIAWVYRNEIEPFMTDDMLALIDGYWQRWCGQQALSTELLERIVARRTFDLLK